MVTFRVDDVTPAAEALPTRPLFDLAPDALAFGRDPATRVIEPNGVHPLLHAIGQAFADHRPLVLSPDAVWLTVTQGVAQHVRLHAEELRATLVEHAGKKRLTVVHDGPMPHDPASWRHFVELFGKQLANEARTTNLFECDFSTSTDVERTAGRVVMLDAYSPYFSLWMRFVCGIPSITLTGTAEDWQKIRGRVDDLAGFGLGTWCRSLAPIMDQFVRAARGDVDVPFWQRIYSPIDAYGGRVVTGWSARFYPYLKAGVEISHPNPLLELPLDEPRDVTPDEDDFYDGPGVRTDSVPATLSQVIVNVNDQFERDNRVVALHAGLVGIAQDDDGALRPLVGWHLTPAALKIDDVLDRIIREHVTTPPRPMRGWSGGADLAAVDRRIGSATLFGGAWRLRPADERRSVQRKHYVSIVFDLADGRSLGTVDDYTGATTYWVVCRVDQDETGRLRLLDDPSEVPVLGTSLAMVLDAALDSGGEIDHLETERLDQLERRLELARHHE